MTGTLTVLEAPPTDIQLSTASVPQSQPGGTVVGAFSTVDADPNDIFTYALAAGSGSTDNASFTIAGDQLETAAPLDYDVQSSFAIRVETTDSAGDSLEKSFVITVTPPQTQQWTGSSGNLWSDGLNWLTSLTPNPGDDLVFQGAAWTATDNNLPAGTALHSITLASSGFVLGGNSVTLASAWRRWSLSRPPAARFNCPLPWAATLPSPLLTAKEA